MQRLTERSLAAGAVAEVPRGLATKAKEFGMDVERPAADPAADAPAGPRAAPAQGAPQANGGDGGASEPAHDQAGEDGSKENGKHAVEGEKDEGGADSQGAANGEEDGGASGTVAERWTWLPALADCSPRAPLLVLSKRAMRTCCGPHVAFSS